MENTMGKTRNTREPKTVIVYPNGYKEYGPGEETKYDWSHTTDNDRWWKDHERLGVLNSRHPKKRRHPSLTKEYNKTGTWTLRLKGGRRWEERDLKSDRLKGAKKAWKGTMKARLRREEDLEINRIP